MSTYNRSIGQRSVIMDKLFLHSASVVVRPKTVGPTVLMRTATPAALSKDFRNWQDCAHSVGTILPVSEVF